VDPKAIVERDDIKGWGFYGILGLYAFILSNLSHTITYADTMLATQQRNQPNQK
jgi:hypothetical protein